MTTDKIKISGIAVREGISRNKRKYIAKELKSFAPTLIGRPILKDHEGVTDNVIGKITTSEFKEDGKMVVYEGWVKEDGTKLLDKMRDGRISEVSIGAMVGKVVKEKEEDDIVIPTQMEALELSTTPVPGVAGTSLFVQSETLNFSDENIKKMIENYDKENNSQSNSISNNRDDQKNQTERRLKMESEEKEKALQLQVETLEKEKAELEKVNTEKVEALEKEKVELEKARKKDAINRYTEKAKAKNITAKDLSNSSMETIQMAIEMVDELPEPSNDDDGDDDSESDEDKEKAKEKAKTKTKDVDNQSTNPNVFEGYVMDSDDVIKGNAFYKYY